MRVSTCSIGDSVVKLLKIGKRLFAVIATDPRKAVALGIGVGLFLYFWNPLTWWQSRFDKAAMAPKSAVASPSVPVLPIASRPAAVAETATARRPSWQQIAEWMRNDRRAALALPQKHERDPFEVLDGELSRVKMERRDVVRPTKRETTVALRLTGTIVGPERSLAQINGKTYAVGQTIDVVRGKDATVVQYRIAEITSQRVLLLAGKERLELTIPGFDSEKMEIEKTGSLQNPNQLTP